MNGDGLADVVLQGLNTTSGNYELVIVNAVNRNTITTINLGSDWDSAPTIYQIGDTDGDGVPNVVAFGGSMEQHFKLLSLHDSKKSNFNLLIDIDDMPKLFNI